jgi:hypothetical protein
MPSTLIKTYRSTLIKVGNTLLGSKLNLFANSETVFANDDRKVSVDDTNQSIKAWFDYMNEEFDKLYEIYT